jgi:poly(A) polymerase
MKGLPERLPDADWRRREGLDVLCGVLGADRGEARFVGGAVRDSLLGIAVNDVDIATVHLPETVVERVAAAGFKPVPTGIAHGTVTAVVRGWPVEITTLRRDVSTDGRRATVAFGTDWREDAARRDFTMNALYADPMDGSLHDYFGGLEDLSAHRVRFIGDADARIAEDHLRILRYFRFTARFGTIDRSSADYTACVTHRLSLQALSRERIADELLKLLALPDPSAAVSAMVEDGILGAVLPEIGGEGVIALGALIAAEHTTGIAADPLRRLLALLPPDAELVHQIAGRLRLSNKARARLVSASRDDKAPSAQGLAHGIGTAAAVDRILLGRAFDLADAPGLVDWAVPHMPLSGGDLIAMGLKAGPQVARTLQTLQRRWVAAGFPGASETRAFAAQLVEAALRSDQ